MAKGGMREIRRDTINERTVRILLECILVVFCFLFQNCLNCSSVDHIYLFNCRLADHTQTLKNGT